MNKSVEILLSDIISKCVYDKDNGTLINKNQGWLYLALYSHNLDLPSKPLIPIFAVNVKFEGELNISGIKQPATIYRDQWHIPHIYAQNTIDMFFCQGYVHAQDRIWQMEMNRRTGMGILSESFGSDALSTDRLIRTLGFNRLAEADYKLLTEKHHSY